MTLFVISHYQAARLLQEHQRGQSQAHSSSDLALTTATVRLDAAGVTYPGGEKLDWDSLAAVAADPNACYRLVDGELVKIQAFSEDTGRAFSLYPTASAPTMLISGLPMHRIKDTDPHSDTLEKIRAARPVVGQVLDTATGLGYTAIEASRTATHVTTIELDPAALLMAHSNPWSQELFDNPKITQRMGDSYDVVAGLEDGSFTRIIHDPPVLALAGDLYSTDFYVELLRILRSGGKLFHYIGDPESKSGHGVTAGVIRRLEQAGFRTILRAPRAFGVTAIK